MELIPNYIAKFKHFSTTSGLTNDDIEFCISYANNLLSKGVPVIFDQEHFSKLLGYEYNFITAMSNATDLFYKKYKIPKKHNGVRIINEPFPDLKIIQTWILNNILNPISKKYCSPVAKAYIKGKSLRENARFHRGKKTVLVFDVKDFFGSIKESYVYECFRNIGYSKAVSTLLYKICTLDGVLPQGSPTSPMLSNMIFKPLDDAIWLYCQKRDICYTRYADDLTFSGNNIDIAHLIIYVNEILKRRQLFLNEQKTNVMGKGTRQCVTGAVVNKVIQVKREYRNKIRQEIYYCKKFGVTSHIQRCTNLPAWIKNSIHYINHLLGKVNYVLQINPNDNEMQSYAVWLKDTLNGAFKNE